MSILAAALLCGAGAHAERVWNYTSYTSEGVAFPGGTFKLSDVAADGSATVTVVTGDRLPWICLYVSDQLTAPYRSGSESVMLVST